jgi:carotenoid 1,2-hydratase
MTERGARHVQRERAHFVVGPSRMTWDGSALEIELEERSVPWARAVRGTLRVRPHALTRFAAPLDAQGRHRWAPIAPCARIEVDLQAPALRWQGAAYLDSNEGDEPIERAFTRWDWLRTASPDGSTTVIYDVQAPGAQAAAFIARRFDADGSDRTVDVSPSRIALAPAPLWRIARHVRAREGTRVLRTLEDTPFYARSLIEMPVATSIGTREAAVHETLDVERLRLPAVQAMLPWRMPRVR